MTGTDSPTIGELHRSMVDLKKSIDDLRDELSGNYVRKDVYDVVQRGVRDELNRLAKEQEQAAASAVSGRKWFISQVVTAVASGAAVASIFLH